MDNTMRTMVAKLDSVAKRLKDAIDARELAAQAEAKAAAESIDEYRRDVVLVVEF